MDKKPLFSRRLRRRMDGTVKAPVKERVGHKPGRQEDMWRRPAQRRGKLLEFKQPRVARISTTDDPRECWWPPDYGLVRGSSALSTMHRSKEACCGTVWNCVRIEQGGNSSCTRCGRYDAVPR
eukprot:1803208-Rhodomonas_salina.1